MVPLLGQDAASLKSVKRIFIDGLGDKPELREVKKDLASRAAQVGRFSEWPIPPIRPTPR